MLKIKGLKKIKKVIPPAFNVFEKYFKLINENDLNTPIEKMYFETAFLLKLFVTHQLNFSS